MRETGGMLQPFAEITAKRQSLRGIVSLEYLNRNFGKITYHCFQVPRTGALYASVETDHFNPKKMKLDQSFAIRRCLA